MVMRFCRRGRDATAGRCANDATTRGGAMFFDLFPGRTLLKQLNRTIYISPGKYRPLYIVVDNFRGCREGRRPGVEVKDEIRRGSLLAAN